MPKQTANESHYANIFLRHNEDTELEQGTYVARTTAVMYQRDMN